MPATYGEEARLAAALESMVKGDATDPPIGEGGLMPAYSVSTPRCCCSSCLPPARPWAGWPMPLLLSLDRERGKNASRRLDTIKSAETDRKSSKANRDRLAEATERRKSVQDSLNDLG